MTTNAAGTHTVTHQVNRLVIDTDATFDDLRQRYESLVPTIDFAELTEMIEADDLSRVRQYTAEHAPHSFVNFWTFDPTPMMQLAGHHTRVVTYMMGNNIIVQRMFQHDPGVCSTPRCAPPFTKTPPAARTSASTTVHPIRQLR